MCRRNQILGIGLIAFGIGLLLGSHFESGFWCSCIAFGIIVFGVTCLRKK